MAKGARRLVKGRVVYDDDASGHDGQIILHFEFEYSAADVGVSFTISPDTTTADEWRALVDAIREGRPMTLSTCRMGGDVFIEHKHGEVTFCTHRTGAGGDGDLTVTFDADRCLTAIEICTTALEHHERGDAQRAS